MDGWNKLFYMESYVSHAILSMACFNDRLMMSGKVGWMDGKVGWMELSGWMDGWNGWMDGWTERLERMDGWMERLDV